MEVETLASNPAFSNLRTDPESPNSDLRSDGMTLGFLECAGSDYKKSQLSLGVDVDPTAQMAAVVKVQKIYRSYRTRRRLADTAVVAEELWWQAIDYARLSRSTISFFNVPETAVSRWTRISLNASKVGKGLSHDSHAQKLAFQHWIEAIDPRHRYGHNLHHYYDAWCDTNSGQPYFFWLDVGDGKDLDLPKCPRSKLRNQCIRYLGPQEREEYEYIVVEGKIIHRMSEELLDTRKGSGGGKFIFVMSTCERLYVGEKLKGRFHHSSFLAGGATLAAGRLVAEDGVLKSISAYSGHYRPSSERLDSFMEFLKEKGVKLDEVEIHKVNEDYSDSYDEKKSISAADPPKSDLETEQVSTNTTNGPKSSSSEKGYRRTLSGGLQSPRAEVPKEAILKRINSRKGVNTYQLGHQLSRKWSTGAGPRIGCVADYPPELRFQALEFNDLSPRYSLRSEPTPTSTYGFKRSSCCWPDRL